MLQVVSLSLDLFNTISLSLEIFSLEIKFGKTLGSSFVQVSLVISTTLTGTICYWDTFFDITLRNSDIYSELEHLPKTVLNPS